MEQQRFTVTAEGLGRLEVLNRISVLYIQRHIPVEQMHFLPIDAKASRFVVCALTTEDTIRISSIAIEQTQREPCRDDKAPSYYIHLYILIIRQ